MANTQTTVPTFVPGQVLEAAQLVNSAATGVPVFATTVTRDAGFGGAGEKTLAEGQLCYLESTNVVQYYDGAAWATLGPAPAASSGLTYVGGGNLSSSSTTFSSVFSATYDNYRIVISEIYSTASQFYLLFTLGAANSNYTYEKMYALPGTAWTNQASSASTTHIHFADVGDSYYSTVTMDLQSPFVSQTTTLYAMNSGYSNSHYMTVGAQKSTTSFTAFTVASNGGETFTGKVRVYGLANS